MVYFCKPPVGETEEGTGCYKKRTGRRGKRVGNAFLFVYSIKKKWKNVSAFLRDKSKFSTLLCAHALH